MLSGLRRLLKGATAGIVAVPAERRVGTPPFDDGLIAEIDRVGFHPFILVRFNSYVGAAGNYAVCTTQNEAAKFADELASSSWLSESKLLRAIERALQLEIYDAADLLLSWVQEPATGLLETAYVGLPAGREHSFYFHYPAFGISKAPRGAVDREDRLRQLIDVFGAYDTAQGNDALRFALMEALAFGLSRALGSEGRYAEAAKIVDRALARRPYSFHLKAARHALALTLDGEKVPARLTKFIGADDGYLKQFLCPVPFERFEIGPSGDVLLCCGHWLPISVGNFTRDAIGDIVNSKRARDIRQSIASGSYKYCNHLECTKMAMNGLPTWEEVAPATRQAAAGPDYRIDGPRKVVFGYDQTCNLSCPSCRRERIVEKASEQSEKARAVEEKLVSLLPTVEILSINPAGELFVSRPSRKLLELVDDARCPNLVINIMSNGTLFNEAEWNKFPGIHNKVRLIRISIDAATKATFEKLRRLGQFETLLDNLRFLSRLRAAETIARLEFAFTYQLDNLQEMRAFVAFCAGLLAEPSFERLQNLGTFSHEEYLRKAVHYPAHPLHRQFIEIIKHPDFHADGVWHDFDFPGVDLVTREQTRARSGPAAMGRDDPPHALIGPA